MDINADLNIAIVIVALTVSVVLYLDSTAVRWLKRLLDWFPAILFAYVVPAVITQIWNLELSTVVLHEWSKQWIMPMAIVMVMSALSIRQLRIIGLRPILVFVMGSLAISTLPVILLMLFGSFTDFFNHAIIDQGYWQGLIPIVGSWIGGSTSQLVLKEVVSCPEGIFLTILIMDNVIVNLWTIIMFQAIQRSDRVNEWLGIKDAMPDFVPDTLVRSSSGRAEVITIGVSLIAILVADFLIDSFLAKIISLSLLGLLFGNIIRGWNHSLVLKVGGLLIIVIMAILGLKLNFDNFSIPPAVVIFCVIWLLLHYGIMLISAGLVKLNMAWVPIASMANVGGISTAPAVTKAYNEEWMPHAILLAILSMVSGTTWGLLTIWLFKTFIV